MTGVAAPPRASTPRPAIQVSAPSAHSAAAQPAQAPPAPTPPPPTSRRPARGSPDYLSDRATASFIRRTLCPQQSGDKARGATAAPIEDLLPPLTSRNDVDLQLYALLAVVLREFVQAWYGKVTPDESFVAEIVQIVAHCTRALEQRLRKVDLESLLFDEMPDLLDRHITGTGPPTAAISQPPSACSPIPRRGLA